LNVLLAEDDKVQVRLLQSHLVGRGFRVHTALDAQAAWEAAEKDPPDVILLDLHMPGGTGLGFLKKRNASAQLRNVPVIVITAMDDPLVLHMAERQNIESIFPKPVDLMLLDVALESVRSRIPPNAAAKKSG
jgi:CheY-like chemotaxis protein